ncbi:hypothetical protein OQA88_992 [Cercophora sp. LCS_1]
MRSFRNVRKPYVYVLAILFTGFLFITISNQNGRSFLSFPQPTPRPPDPVTTDDDPDFLWRKLPIRYPVESMASLPSGKGSWLPKIQASFRRETSAEKQIRHSKRDAVKQTFVRCWESYKKHAWMSDEITPISGGARNPFGGWAATLVDSLDTLWIMGLREDFELAVAAATNISFETATIEEVNVFETNIRYLGGFLSAYDLSGDKRLLRKAKEVGDMLYAAFDTPNRMPITRWHLREAAKSQAQGGPTQVAHDGVLLAEMGSFSMEFTRLSILTGDPKWFDAAQRITDILEAQQSSTNLPGMWPLVVNAKDKVFNRGDAFTLGAMADSTYEYLPKTYALSGGRLPVYRTMYQKAMDAAITHNMFQPMIPDEKDILISAMVHVGASEDRKPQAQIDPEGQHLVCFAGGMLALGSKLFNLPSHLETARKLVDGCIWTYQALPLGVMPETFHMIPCPSTDGPCPWNETLWKKEVLHRHGADPKDTTQADKIIAQKRLPKGLTKIGDTRYILRPEAIESVFVLHRATGRKDLLDTAWKMWQAVETNTRTTLANAALADITTSPPPKMDSMESFWMGETLKYFYLIFDETDHISVDEYVFNTEAHPLRIMPP